MRRNEITPELIELSKRAKELGFPQDVEMGDWFIFTDTKEREHTILKYVKDALLQRNIVLILSFSRCLEWLNKEKYGVTLGLNTFIWDQYIFFVGTQSSRAKTHHEAIAKAVVKILEGEE